MAIIVVLSYPSLSSRATASNVVSEIKRAERKAFPRHEALDFDLELSKRNVELVAVVEDMPPQPRLVAYLLVARWQKTALLHKVCVLQQYRRQGIATRLIQLEIERLRKSGCLSIQLWVDEQREAARYLYTKVGFEDAERVENYYALCRSAVKMALRM